MLDNVAHKRWWEIFEVVFGIPFLVAIALQRLFTIPLSQGFLTEVTIPAGDVLIVVGVSLVVLARREFVRHNQPTVPGLPANKIITTGEFSFSRNPLYLGGVIFLLGISLVFQLT